MKRKFNRIISVATLLSLIFVPIAAHAQQPVIDVNSSESTPTTLPETGAGVPNAGIEPSENKALQNAAVFAGGSLLGVGIGLGIIKLRKNNLEK